jgi:hypothetical protein
MNLNTSKIEKERGGEHGEERREEKWYLNTVRDSVAGRHYFTAAN